MTFPVLSNTMHLNFKKIYNHGPHFTNLLSLKHNPSAHYTNKQIQNQQNTLKNFSIDSNGFLEADFNETIGIPMDFKIHRDSMTNLYHSLQSSSVDAITNLRESYRIFQHVFAHVLKDDKKSFSYAEIQNMPQGYINNKELTIINSHNLFNELQSDYKKLSYFGLSNGLHESFSTYLDPLNPDKLKEEINKLESEYQFSQAEQEILFEQYGWDIVRLEHNKAIIKESRYSTYQWGLEHYKDRNDNISIGGIFMAFALSNIYNDTYKDSGEKIQYANYQDIQNNKLTIDEHLENISCNTRLLLPLPILIRQKEMTLNRYLKPQECDEVCEAFYDITAKLRQIEDIAAKKNDFFIGVDVIAIILQTFAKDVVNGDQEQLANNERLLAEKNVQIKRIKDEITDIVADSKIELAIVQELYNAMNKRADNSQCTEDFKGIIAHAINRSYNTALMGKDISLTRYFKPWIAAKV